MLRAPLAALLVVGLAGCEAGLDPIAASDRYFSLSGYLDATADTQWVRVEPVSESLVPQPDPLDVTVTLEPASGAAAAAFRQRVRAFATGPAHLFWTTADVRPGETYVVAVRRPDGAETRATVVVPAATAEITVVDGPFQCPTLVYVRGAARVADVQARYGVQSAPPRRYRFTKVASFVTEVDGSLRAAIYPGDDALQMDLSSAPGSAAAVTSEVTVAVGTDDWPEALGLDLETALVPRDTPRIQNGVGFIGGVVTTTRPFVPGAGSAPPPGSGLPPRPCTSSGR